MQNTISSFNRLTVLFIFWEFNFHISLRTISLCFTYCWSFLSEAIIVLLMSGYSFFIMFSFGSFVALSFSVLFIIASLAPANFQKYSNNNTYHQFYIIVRFHLMFLSNLYVEAQQK